MTTLAPTVHERLARCGTSVYVDGLVTGAEIVLSIDGTEYSQIAMGGSVEFTVPPLIAGASVRANQDSGAGFSPWSPQVVVENAAVPPHAAPLLPEEIGACSHCVLVWGLVPGCDIELLLGSEVVGKGISDRDGSTCVGVDLGKAKGELPSVLRARMIVCGEIGPDATRPIVAEPALPQPMVGSPLFGCQRVIPLSNLHRGARARLETNTGTYLGSFCSCWTAVNVYIGQALVVGERVRGQMYWEGVRACKADGPWSDWQPVVPPDERIKPKVLEVLIAGDQIIRVENQIAGADLLIKIRPSESQPAEEFGPRPASTELAIALNAPLSAGNVVSVLQTLCGVSVESDPVIVQPAPPIILAPVIIPPLNACGAAVQVSNLHPGALVRLYLDGIPIGVRWAGLESSISVPASPALVAGGKVTAKQWVGGSESPESDPPVEVLAPKSVQPPRIRQPVALGDRHVWVSRVTPGAHVSIRAGATLIGEADAAEPIVRVPVDPVAGPILAQARLCRETNLGAEVTPITDPCTPGVREHVGEEFRAYANWMVPATADGDAFETRIEGQLYFPATSDGKFDRDATNLPLVVIAHGYWAPDVESYKGYDYLARHLVSWGMLVFSINLDDVNGRTSTSKTYQFSRAEIILHAIDALLADSGLGQRIKREGIGLVGHSMSGEGVAVAQWLNETEGRGYGIQGVVSIAPTHWRPDVTLRQTKYLQLLGSMDLLVSSLSTVTGPDTAAHFSGFRIYDRAWRPKTHFWIYQARHNPFNRAWLASGDTFEAGWADQALPPQDHERIARCLINAFFQDALFGQTVYAGYMEGTILPQSLHGLQIHTQHSREPRVVLDNFGDLDEQIPLAAAALDKAWNSLGLAVGASGAGLGIWEDIEHTSLAHSPHNTKGVQLSWRSPDVVYTSDSGGLSVALTDVVAQRISQFYEDAMLNPTAQSVDLFVILSDGMAEAMIRLGAIAQVPYPDSSLSVLCPMRTIRLPCDAFKAANPALNLSNITSVRLRLACRGTGDVLLDDLELGN